MTAANICLVALAALAAAFLGGFCAAFIGAFVGNPVLGDALGVPAMLIGAHLMGRWVNRREHPPSRRELIAGGVLYGVMSLLAGVGSGHPHVMLFALVGAGMNGFFLFRAAIAGRNDSPAQASRRTA